MNKRLLTAATLALAPLATQVSAGTLIEARAQEHRQIIRVDGQNVRIETDQNKSYIVFDGTAKTAIVIDPSHKSAVKVDTQQIAAWQNSSEPTEAPAFKLEKQGQGPAVAGFATEQYRLTLDGKSCGDIFVAPEASKIQDIETLFNLGRNMGKPPAAKSGCDGYSPALQSQLAPLGLPVKRSDAAGNTVYEILSIKEAQLASSDFAVPAGYQITDTQAMLQGALKSMKGLDTQMNPDMLKQLQAQQQQMLEQLKKAQSK